MAQDLKTKAYERGIQAHLKSIAESGSDVHQNHTPAEICDMMLDKLDLSQPKSMLVLYNIELLFALKKRKFSGHVTFFTQSQEKADLAPKIFSNLTVEYIDKEENPLYHMETKWPDKFDIVIANPPYSKKLDLKFLDKAFDIAKEDVVFVHPATFITDRKAGLSIFGTIKEKIKNKLESITLFNGNGIFGIGLYVPCAITHIGKSKDEKEFLLINLIENKGEFKLGRDKIDEISVFGYTEHFISLEKKMCSGETLNTRSFFSRGERILSSPDKFVVSTSRIQGASTRGPIPINNKMYNDDFFVLLRRGAVVLDGETPKYDIWWEFDTRSEAENFISYCKTNFARMCLALTKNDCSINGVGMSKIPWMDFNQEWTDEKLYAHFNITEGEQAFIKEVIPPYYD